ncbi:MULTISPECIES: MBL fold metallo-hydrolase [unclassified Cellulophaga]|uniref:MBL fold metallo-hydrolase n=1 Tax=unclassified Cellulophaga TaxID=2634405 RepID=UPI0026E2CD9D|nr:MULTISPECIES: MBL fold metallo-hydrolase [unclassified Cellulophaga]MDO6491550.1 MBL fold metallo-hydrolase [Cellulophaga sp. 2_MG-2023]MDO6493427.1 MBL fold metallo-hydrolase [Cellulophaga sp. 3_MG-2023]
MKKLTSIVVICLFLVSCKDEKKTDIATKNTTIENSKERKSNFKVIPIEHATAVFNWGDTTIYIDPVGGVNMFKNQDKPNLILVTDIHGDHLNVETLEAINTEKTTIIAPQAVADKLSDNLKTKLTVLNNDESVDFTDIKITAIPMYNLREEAIKFHSKGRGNGYLLEKNGERVYFSGDTEDIPEMRALQNIDKAFICMNLPYTMTVNSAASAVLEFKPKQVYPYHYRGKPDVSDIDKFKKLVTESNKDIEVVQLDWYPNNSY